MRIDGHNANSYKAELQTEICELKKIYQREHDEAWSGAGIVENFVERMRALEERIDDRWRKICEQQSFQYFSCLGPFIRFKSKIRTSKSKYFKL